MPLANVSLAQPILLRQLNLLHRHELPPGERFAILEALRQPVIEVQAAAAAIFAGRPLPLANPEQAALERTLEVWSILAQGYLRSFTALCDAGGGRNLPLTALLAQRALAAFADWQVDLCRGEQLPDAAYWRDLHQVIAVAEALGITETAVSDPLRHGGTQTSALAAYAECNLLSAATGACRVVAGFEAVHFQLSGRQAFRAPSRDDATLRREREEFETFGERRHTMQTDSGRDDSQVENWLVMDDWQVVNESATGLCLARPLREGVRIGAGMLTAVKIGSSERFVLACVRWALRGADDMLQAGIQLFPGEARPVAIRAIDPGEDAGAWRKGLLLPEIPALRVPTSLVVPAGTFKLERRIEVMVEHQPRLVKLFRVLERGSEFERCSLYAGG